jgi:hypothetical protein
MKKKNLSYYLLPTTYIILLISLASAGPVEGVRQLAEGLGEIIVILIQFISDTILNINSFDEYLFAKILLFSIILLVVYTVIKKNTIFGGSNNKPIQWIISSAVAILSIRYISDEFIEVILLQYGTLAIGIGMFLPLMIFFFFLHQSELGPFGRRIGWIVYGVSFMALWIFRYEEIGAANMLYWIGLAIVLFLILFDSSIHKYFGMSSIRKAWKEMKIESRVDAQRRLKELEENRDFYSDGEYKMLREKLIERVKENI